MEASEETWLLTVKSKLLWGNVVSVDIVHLRDHGCQRRRPSYFHLRLEASSQHRLHCQHTCQQPCTKPSERIEFLNQLRILREDICAKEAAIHRRLAELSSEPLSGQVAMKKR